jgi:PilZ domain
MDATAVGVAKPAEGHDERRSEHRSEVNLRGRIKSFNPLTSSSLSTGVRIIEISRRGLKIEATLPYIPYSLVQVTIGNQMVMGEVRHCTQIESGFHVGIEKVDDGTVLNSGSHC